MKTTFSQSDPSPVPHVLWLTKLQAYRADEGVDINTVLVDGEEIVNVGFIADGEWLRYTVDLTYIGGIENTKGASVEQKTYSSTLEQRSCCLLLSYTCGELFAATTARGPSYRNLPAWSVQLARAARFIGRQKWMFYVSVPSFPPPSRHTKYMAVRAHMYYIRM